MANWYLDNAAVGTNAGTSWTNAWESFADIVWGAGGVVAGDTLYISGGAVSKTYTGQLTIGASGTAGSRITVSVSSDANHNGKVIFDGENTASYGVLCNQSYVTLYGAGVKGIGSRWELINQTYTTIYSTGSRTSVIVDGLFCKEILLVHGGIKYHNTISSIIRNCRITTHATSGIGQVDGIYAQYTNGDRYHDNWIGVYSESLDSGDHCDCIQGYQNTNLTIDHNYCENINEKTSNSQGIYLTTSYGYQRIYNNIVNGGDHAMDLICVRNLTLGTAVAEIYNNTVYAGHSSGSSIIFTTEMADPIIKNNIVHYYGTSGFALRVSNWAGTASNIDYNLLYAPNYTYVGYTDGGKTWAQWQALGFDVHGVNANPLLANPAGKLFMIGSASPAKDAGVTIAMVSDDFYGVIRPAGAAYDIGACETDPNPWVMVYG